MLSLINFLKKLYHYRPIIIEMALHDIKSRYTGTIGGGVWSVVGPLLTIMVYWFVFSFGLRVQPVENIPYIAYFCAGMVPWMIINDTLLASTTAITRNAYLVKKMVFPTEILPIINLVANMISHGVLLLVLAVILFLNGISFSIYNLQVIYYLVALSVFSISLSWLVSSVNVFFRDTAMIVGVVSNIWFWMTPVVWLLEVMPGHYQLLIKLNPVYYIVDGYRRSFIYHTPFWENYWLGAYFWAVSLILLVFGGVVFRKLKHDFADVL